MHSSFEFCIAGFHVAFACDFGRKERPPIREEPQLYVGFAYEEENYPQRGRQQRDRLNYGNRGTEGNGDRGRFRSHENEYSGAGMQRRHYGRDESILDKEEVGTPGRSSEGREERSGRGNKKTGFSANLQTETVDAGRTGGAEYAPVISSAESNTEETSSNPAGTRKKPRATSGSTSL